MQNLYKYTSRALIAYIGMLFIAMFLSVGFEGSELLNSIGTGLGAATICTFPFLFLLFAIGGIGALVERRNNQNRGKRKNEALLFDTDAGRMEHILNRLSADDRAYVERYLASRQMGLADDGEIVSLDDLMLEDDEDSQASLFTG